MNVPKTPYSRVQAPRARRWFALPLLILMMGLAACDTGTGTDSGDVEGLWVGTAGNLTVYVRITDTSVTVWEGLDDVCFNTRSLEIVSSDGDSFTLQEAGETNTIQITFGREGDQLRTRNLISSTQQFFDASQEDLSGVEECQVVGTWGLTEDDFVSTVVITAATFSAYEGLADGCRDVFRLTITDQDGDTYTLTDADGNLVVDIVNEAGTLVVTFPAGNSLSYQASMADPSTFDICGGGDESSVACADLPAIPVGGSVNGDLTTTDPLSSPDNTNSTGWYYDLYGLTLDSQQQVQIDLTSDAIDPYLRFWDADGGFLASNDDNATSFNSTISATLDAACYIIEATSFGFEETGAYTLTVN